MQIKPIRSEADLKAALKTISKMMDADPPADSPDSDRLEVLATLVEAYERTHYSLSPPDPIEAIKFRMEQGGLKASDLVPMIGNLNRVYEVLRGTRQLTLRMIRNLHEQLGIPLASLVGVSDTQKANNDNSYALAG